MSPRDRLVLRTLVALVAMLCAISLYEVLNPDLHRLAPTSLVFTAAFGLAVVGVRAGHRTAVGWVVVTGGTLFQGWNIVNRGGPESADVAAAPLAAVIAWVWIGWGGALTTTVVLTSALLVGYALDPGVRAVPPLEHLFLHLTAILIAFSFLAALIRELRGMVERTWEQEQEARAAAVEAERAHQARERFLEKISRDLRHPLDAIAGYTEILCEDERDPERLQDVKRIRAAGLQLTQLVDDMLDLSLRHAEDIPFHLAPLSLRAVLDDVVATTLPQAAAQRDRVLIDVAAELPPVVSDAVRVRQILLNLMSNAIKYTAAGEVRIEVRTAGERVHVAVSDTGIGIPPEKMDRLFQPFVQLHEGAERRPGIGLGLALSQRLAIRLGGAILAQSTPGVGSTFTLVLPTARAELRPAA